LLHSQPSEQLDSEPLIDAAYAWQASMASDWLSVPSASQA